MSILRILLAAVACLALAQTAQAVSVTIFNGTVELETNKWNVSLYVRQFDVSTQQWTRVPSFQWNYWITNLYEYWDKEVDVECDCMPYNYSLSLPSVEQSIQETTDQEIYPGGALGTNINRVATLPNGARFIQTVTTFDKDTYKDISGWKLPLAANSVKIVSRVENWPYTTPNPRNPSSGPTGRKIMMRGYTLTKLIPREDASMLAGFDSFPFFVYQGRSLQEPVGATPADPILNYDLVFRHRFFNLSIGFLENSTSCDNNMESSCVWRDVDVAGLARGSNSQIAQFLFAQVPIGFDRDSTLQLKTDIFIGMTAHASPIVEWDPNLDLVFGAGYSSEISSGAPRAARAPADGGVVDFATGTGSLAVYIAIPVAVVVVGAAVVAVVLYRRKASQSARVRVQQIMSRHSINEQQQSQPAQTQSTPQAASAPEPMTPRSWASSSRPTDVRNTYEPNN